MGPGLMVRPKGEGDDGMEGVIGWGVIRLYTGPRRTWDWGAVPRPPGGRGLGTARTLLATQAEIALLRATAIQAAGTLAPPPAALLPTARSREGVGAFRPPVSSAVGRNLTNPVSCFIEVGKNKAVVSEGARRDSKNDVYFVRSL